MADDKMNIGYFSRSNEILNNFIGEYAKICESQSKYQVVDKEKALKDFENFEKLVCSSPKMKMVFAALQKKFADDPKYASGVDPNFVAGVMLLDLSELNGVSTE